MYRNALRYTAHASLLLSLLLCWSHGTASGELLSVRLTTSGVLEAVGADIAEPDSRNFEPGSALVCRWRMPDVDSDQWTLKDRGIIYTRAYRRCWATGSRERVRSVAHTPDGRYLVADAGQAGFFLISPKGTSRPVAPPAQYHEEAGEETHEAFAVEGKPGFFALYTHHQRSILSRLLDRWQSDIFWFPDPENTVTHQLILSRTHDRVQKIAAFSRRDLRLTKSLREASMTPASGASGRESEESPERRKLKEQWPWLVRADQVGAALIHFLRENDAAAEDSSEEPNLYLLLNSRRFARLVPGSGEMDLFPEFETDLFRDKILDFHVMDENTLLILVPTGLYQMDINSGSYRLQTSFPLAAIKKVHPALAVTSDHRYAAVMFWTRAHRNEIYLANLGRSQNLKRLVRGEMDMRFVPGIDTSALFNPNGFNFAPDGLSLVTLWRLKDGQEIRVFRLLDGDLAPLPPEKEENEIGSQGVPEPVPDMADD